MGFKLWVPYAAAWFALVAGQQCSQLVCSADYDPVCGSDSMLYTNICQLQAASCKCNYCIAVIPMCATGCTSRSSQASCATMSGQSCGLTTCGAYYGTAGAASTASCVKSCNSVLSPVCGSDGRTYSNECNFEIARCLSGNALTMVKVGGCASTSSSTFSATSVRTCARKCTMEYSPVCASDGNTYANECVLAVAACQSTNSVVKISNSRCAKTVSQTATSATTTATVTSQSDCVKQCPMEARFVCASNGLTYFNPCFFEIAACQAGGDVIKAADGLCPARTVPTPTRTTLPVTNTAASGQNCDQVCSMQYTPVCGSDGVTYGNRCLMVLVACQKGIDIKEVRSGECEDSEMAIAMVGDVPNANTSVDGTLTAQGTDCERQCKALYEPVCGSDGRTYANECAFEIANCVLNGTLTMTEGVCAVSPSSSLVAAMGGALGDTEDTKTTATTVMDCMQACSKERSPVCGSNGLTYANLCVLEVASCRSGGKVVMVSEGPCDPNAAKTAALAAKDECDLDCPAESNPVCGSDGVTYSSACELEAMACRGNLNITQVSDSACDSEPVDLGKPTPPYARCRVPVHCVNVFGGRLSEWTCTDPMVCRPAQCTLDDDWQVASCGPSECSTSNTFLDRLGYCTPSKA